MLKWTTFVPGLGWAMILGSLWLGGPVYLGLMSLVMIACVLASVHHAEAIAHRFGEPFGTLVLAGAVTVIEVGLIVSLMISGGEATITLARDTVFAAVMIILNGIIGICLFTGSYRHKEQTFSLPGVTSALTTLAAIAVLTLILPNYTLSVQGPLFSASQLLFIAIVAVGLYAAFVMHQTVQHPKYFAAGEDKDVVISPAGLGVTSILLFLSLGAVVLIAKNLATPLELMVARFGAPQAVVGVMIAFIILLPEAFTAFRAARMNQLQKSMNLALGSALASIGLTIPAVAIVSLTTKLPLTLGLDQKESVLLLLSLFVSTLSLGLGTTTVLQGTVHLMIFAVYLFTTIVP